MQKAKIKYLIAGTIAITLQELFSSDTDYPYTSDPRTTSIIITPSYPILNVDNKVPQVVVGDIQYSMQRTSLGNDFSNYIWDTDLTTGKRIQVGEVRKVPMGFSGTITVYSTNQSEVDDLIDVIAYELFLKNPEALMRKGLHIEQVSVGDSKNITALPQFEFGAQLALFGTTVLQYINRYATNNSLLENIKLTLS